MSGAIILCLLLQAAAAGQTPFERGAALYRERNYAAAIDALKEALDSEPAGSANHTEALLLLGQSYYSAGRFTEAIPVLEKRLALADRPEGRYMLGTAYIQAREFDGSRVAFAALYNLPPASAAARLLNAQMLVRNGLEAEADAELQPAWKGGTSIPGVHLLAGELATHRGDYEAAARHLTEELRINPTSSTAYYKLGDAYTRREAWPEAIACLQKSIWLNPYYSGPFILLGRAYLKTDSLANAEGMLRRAIELDPGNRMAHYLLGQTLQKAGKTEEGKSMLRRSQELTRER